MHPPLDRMSRSISTGHLLADCERWCRDVLPPREAWVQRTTPARSNVTSLRDAAQRLREGTQHRLAS
ncbi:hypothetical protein ACI78R_07305 [Geodermatophilus sp. SYSU D01106]